MFTLCIFYIINVYIWNKKETLLLIHLYKENEVMFTRGKIKQHLCWEQIAKEMAKKGYTISRKKCCTKFQSLKRTYKQIKDHNNRFGNLRKTWEYFEVCWHVFYNTFIIFFIWKYFLCAICMEIIYAMDELYGTKLWVELTAVAGSNINNVFESDESSDEQKSKNIYVYRIV